MTGISIQEINIIIIILAASTSLFIGFRVWRRRYAERAYGFVPLAYDTILNNVPLGIVVTDMSDRIVAVNQSVRHYMDSSIIDPIGRTIKDVFSAYTSYIDSPRLHSEAKDEWRIGSRSFAVQLSPMVDERGVQRGHIYVLRDTTA